ncbi:hypothetical protein B0H11DRAFT_2012117 [Mycena galericulata]|nr:hypothetical protein B0H11DRAFT_2012117 [Mycena galericulata]
MRLSLYRLCIRATSFFPPHAHATRPPPRAPTSSITLRLASLASLASPYSCVPPACTPLSVSRLASCVVHLICPRTSPSSLHSLWHFPSIVLAPELSPSCVSRRVSAWRLPSVVLGNRHDNVGGPNDATCRGHTQTQSRRGEGDRGGSGGHFAGSQLDAGCECGMRVRRRHRTTLSATRLDARKQSRWRGASGMRLAEGGFQSRRCGAAWLGERSRGRGARVAREAGR